MMLAVVHYLTYHLRYKLTSKVYILLLVVSRLTSKKVFLLCKSVVNLSSTGPDLSYTVFVKCVSVTLAK